MRVLLTVAVKVRCTLASGKGFEEDTQTLVVNAHGALVLLKNAVTQGQLLTVVHVATKEQLPCRVAYVGPIQEAKTQVGLEFTQPAPAFWQINFPPDNWKIPTT